VAFVLAAVLEMARVLETVKAMLVLAAVLEMARVLEMVTVVKERVLETEKAGMDSVDLAGMDSAELVV